LSNKKLKEVKFRPRTEAHDLEFKTRHAREFLSKGHSVRLVVMFRGREMVHPEIGEKLLAGIVASLADVGAWTKPPVMNGRDMTVMVVPK
jgi:translation initiation factor IF-3